MPSFWARNATSLGGGTLSRHSTICSSTISSSNGRWRRASGFSPSAVIFSRNARKVSWRRVPSSFGSSQRVRVALEVVRGLDAQYVA